MPRCIPSWIPFLDRFLIDFCSQLRPTGSQKTLFFFKENNVFSKNRLSKITSISASILVPKTFPKSTKIPSKIDFKRHRFFDRFLHRFFFDFGSILEANLGPCWPHFPQKWSAAVARRPLFCWLYVIFRFGGPHGPLLAPFGLDFGGFGAPFWRFLQGSLPHVRSSKDFSALEKLIEQHTIQNQSHH